MKIKSFFAPNLVNALNIIETLYKKDAVIHSVTSVNQGVKVCVFIKKQKKDFDIQTEKILEKKKYFSLLLKHHAFDEVFIDRLVRATKNKSVKPNDDKLLSSALEELFRFKPIYPMTEKKVYVLTGNAGSGKTSVLKKMALLAQREKINPSILSLQPNHFDLENFSNEHSIPFQTITNLSQLNETVTLLRLQSDYILIDTPALNPFNKEDMFWLKTIKTQISDAEFILTMPAGLDDKEAIAQGALFNKNGCTLLIATQLDSHVKYSGLCQALLHNQIQLSALCFSNNIFEPIIEATPQNLAKLFAPSTCISESQNERK